MPKEPKSEANAIEEKEEDMDDKQNVYNDFLEDVNEGNAIDFSNKDVETQDDTQLLLIVVHLTSLDLDVKELNCRQNVMIPRTFFIEEADVERNDPCPFGSTMETCSRTKEARQSAIPTPTRASSLDINTGFVGATLQTFTKNLSKSNLYIEMQFARMQ